MRVSLGSGGQSITLQTGGRARAALRRRHSATDARGRTLHSWLVLQGGGCCCASIRAVRATRCGSTRGSSRAKSSPAAGERGEEGGVRLQRGAVRRKASTALIGGPADNEGVGAAWVFTRSGDDMDPAGREADRRRRGRRRRLRRERRAVRRRQHRADRRPGRQRRHRRGVGLHAHERRLEPAGREDHGQKRRRDRRSRRLRLQRGAGRRQRSQHRPGRRPGQRRRAGAALVFTRASGVWTQQGAKLVAKSGEETGKEGEFGDSVALSTEGSTTATYALIGAPDNSKDAGARGSSRARRSHDLEPAGRKTHPQKRRRERRRRVRLQRGAVRGRHTPR